MTIEIVRIRAALAALMGACLGSCSPSSFTQALEEKKPATLPPTVFDKTPPEERPNAVKISSFIFELERKYKREATRNPIDLHFKENGPGRLKVIVTYDSSADPTLAASIANAAVDLAKRLKREDPTMRDIHLEIDREISPR